MPKVSTITWRQLTGNKFSKAIDSAMLSQAGYVCFQRIRQVGGETPQAFNVKYDRDYLIQVIVRKFIKPLSVLGREKTIELVNNAYDLYDKEMLTPQGLSEGFN